ncbi:4-phosphoerythronate dehydrogenase [Cellvibrio fibrivorans]|uniref:Erythronate-4-phosphate dehydrogenase n=1 Tax=Cellvibrio fibrivorans TaxID=126350 RepID=A0ABU1UYC0_9GAMM|nr:4-phosphoerythronate dehydrogenase [Cellvibrio fibrivorans]MDR7090156.1 erythronate-4-phosphate dehydrogenase [Cellvibrio fibrivorans]
MRIVADENIPLVNAFFGHMGEVVCLPGRTMTAADVRDADALIVRSVTKVNPALLEGSKVKFVGTCTIGVDHLDQAYLDAHGVKWSSAPGCNANSVVEFVYAALCHLDINWLPVKFGIIGCGNVGGLLYKRLKAQGVDVLCYDPNLTLAQNPDLTSLEEVLACDVISMHTPLVTTGAHPSFHLLGRKELLQLKLGAVLINCGRGPVIDNQALLDVLTERNDLRVVLDVWEPEPDISLELLNHVLLGSPHIAGYSYDGKLNGTELIYQALCRHLDKSPQSSLTALVPPLANNQLRIDKNIDKHNNIFNIAKELIKQVYDIAADDARLRALATQAFAGEVVFGEGFDSLRKHYPVRREFHNYQVHLESITDTDKKWLQVLGFHCV